MNRTIKKVTMIYLSNPNVKPIDYNVNIRAIAFYAANIHPPKGRSKFYEFMETNHNLLDTIKPKPTKG